MGLNLSDSCVLYKSLCHPIDAATTHHLELFQMTAPLYESALLLRVIRISVKPCSGVISTILSNNHQMLGWALSHIMTSTLETTTHNLMCFPCGCHGRRRALCWPGRCSLGGGWGRCVLPAISAGVCGSNRWCHSRMCGSR
ncbi:hypothetical protein D1007_52688 [Hordeum vulgare]|nr:hypothetical protein D1007_52688 [Hordeum vulgare]